MNLDQILAIQKKALARIELGINTEIDIIIIAYMKALEIETAKNNDLLKKIDELQLQLASEQRGSEQSAQALADMAINFAKLKGN